MKRKSAMLNYLHEVIKKERQTSADEKMEDSNNGDSQESQKHPRGRFSRRGHLDQLAVPSTSNRHHSNPSAGRTVPYVLPHEIGLKNTYLSESGKEYLNTINIVKILHLHLLFNFVKDLGAYFGFPGWSKNYIHISMITLNVSADAQQHF